MNELWSIENEIYDSGVSILCGVDEAGRGPLAGPVCAAACILPRGLVIDGLDDSKKLSDKKRRELFDVIKREAVSFGVAFASVEEIEEHNILRATFMAMNRAIAKLDVVPELAIIDGNRAVFRLFNSKTKLRENCRGNLAVHLVVLNQQQPFPRKIHNSVRL